MVRPMSLDRVNDVSHLALDCADGATHLACVPFDLLGIGSCG